MKINYKITAAALGNKIERLWEVSAPKLLSIEESWNPSKGSPVFTVQGKYDSRGWTEWTQGFRVGSLLLQFDATGDTTFLEGGRGQTLEEMTPHLTHFGVHDHGFNNVSTYGTLWRLMNEGAVQENSWERNFYELALKTSGAIQARRWTALPNGGYIYSFNGPHSLFADTIRSLRSLAIAHQLGHAVMDENDRRISLLERLIQHAQTTAEYNVYYGENRDAYDVRGRVAHESIFNLNDGNYRCPNTQQGYSPLTTWTRGLAWIMCGYAEELEMLRCLDSGELEAFGGKERVLEWMLRAARASCDFYVENTPLDGIPYWDTGAPLLDQLGDYLNQRADPFNEFEPVDSSAAAIAAQGLLRLGRYLETRGDAEGRPSTAAAERAAQDYWQAGLTILETLLDEPYLSLDLSHQGLILHSVYHRPRGWDYIPPGRKISCDESSMWGDYHARELALYVQRIAQEGPYLKFFR